MILLFTRQLLRDPYGIKFFPLYKVFPWKEKPIWLSETNQRSSLIDLKEQNKKWQRCFRKSNLGLPHRPKLPSFFFLFGLKTKSCFIFKTLFSCTGCRPKCWGKCCCLLVCDFNWFLDANNHEKYFWCSSLSKVALRLRSESLKLIGSAVFGATLNLHGYTCQIIP